jgi:hypothetical protein
MKIASLLLKHVSRDTNTAPSGPEGITTPLMVLVISVPLVVSR